MSRLIGILKRNGQLPARSRNLRPPIGSDN
jgi:hypothetical protein